MSSSVERKSAQKHGPNHDDDSDIPAKQARSDKANGTAHEKTSSTKIVETGSLFFMYKPKVDVDEASNLDEVQRFHLMMIPDGQVTTKRLLIIAKKKLPKSKRDRHWAFVQKTADDVEEIAESALEQETYETKTKGTRHVKADRMAGEGKYAIIKHEDHSHIAYVLESPEELGEVQKAFNIQKEDSFIVTVKNPHKKQTQGVGLPSKDKVKYPEEIQEIFDDHAWIPVEPELLEFEGTEMIWIPSGHDIEHGLGKAGKKLEQIVDTKNAKDVMAEAHLDPDEHPTQALKDGKWPSPSKE